MGQWADMPMSQLKNEKSTKSAYQPIGRLAHYLNIWQQQNLSPLLNWVHQR